MARGVDLSISFEDAIWMINNQSLREVKPLPNNKLSMTHSEVIEYLQVEADDWLDRYESDWSVRYNDIKWLYFEMMYDVIAGEGGFAEITFETNMDWELIISSIPSWLVLENSNTGQNDSTIEFTAGSNPSSTADRTADIQIKIGHKTYTQTITQYKRNIQHEYVDINIYQLSRTTTSATFATSDMLPTRDMAVEYRKKGSTSWFAADVIATNTPPQWTVDNLDSGTDYEFQISTSYSLSPFHVIHYTSNILEIATQVSLHLTVSRSSITIDSDTTNFNFNIQSNTTWTISDNASWITVNPTSGSNNRNNITVTLQQNHGNQRNGTITITGQGTGTRSISVTQRAIQLYPVTIRGNSFTINEYVGAATADAAMNNLQMINAFATETFQNVGLGTTFFQDQNANQQLQVTEVSWFKLSTTNIALQLDNNGYVLQRVDTGQELSLPSSQSWPVTGGSRTINVTSNTSWVVASSPSWITITNGSGTGNGSFTATASSNGGNNTDDRTGNITVRSTDLFREATTLAIQEGTYIVEGIEPNVINAPSEASQVFFNVYTNGSWTVNIPPPPATPFGLSATPQSGTGTRTNVRIDVPANFLSNSRTMVIQVNIGGTNYSLTINQAGS